MSSTTPPSVTFDVSDVDPATKVLPDVEMSNAYTSLLSPPVRPSSGYTGNDVNETPRSVVEACSDPAAKVVKPSGFHPLFDAVNVAFALHYPLVLTPDAIWLTIVQGLATHINLNPEKYRAHFVAHEGKKRIKVQRDDFVLGSADNHWQEVFSEFSEEIRADIGAENHDLLVADFSTTGAVERAASEVALMDSMQSYFEYYVGTMCGIPTITLEGTLADWQALHAKVESLYRYPDLEWWLDSVSVLAREFVNAYEGSVDLNFWQSFYKINDGSGGPYMNGWVVKLLPYVKNYDDDDKVTRRNPLLAGGYHSGITHDQLPGSLSVAPFVWNYFGEEHPYEFLAGIIGVTQDAESLALRPKVGWAVRPAPASATQ